MPSRLRQPSISPKTVTPASTTVFHQLPQSYQQQLAHLIADLIRRVRTAAQTREDDHEH